jgi:hypothetical protein
MSRDMDGAPAPRPLTQWIDHLKRERIAGRKTRAVSKKRRAITEQRATHAEQLLAEIVAGADVIAVGVDPEGYPAAYLLLTLHRGSFDDLASFGAEREDLETSHDREPGEDDEPSVGVDADEFDPCDLGEQKQYPATADEAMVAQARFRIADRAGSMRRASR